MHNDINICEKYGKIIVCTHSYYLQKIDLLVGIYPQDQRKGCRPTLIQLFHEENLVSFHRLLLPLHRFGSDDVKSSKRLVFRQKTANS